VTPRRTYTRHGLNAAMVRVKLRGFQAVDRRTVAARTALAWRRDMLEHLGGESACTAPQIALGEMGVRTRIFIDHADCFLMGSDPW
jgi:hypothetical protein